MSFGRTAARDGNQVRFLPAAQLALPARPRPVVDGGFESLIDEPSPRSGDSEGAYRNRLSRLAVRQPFQLSATQGPALPCNPAGYLNQIGPLGWCQFDFVLYGRHIRVRPPWKIIPKPTQSHILYQHFMEPVLGTPRKKRRGIPGTKWIHIGQASYDRCRDYPGRPGHRATNQRCSVRCATAASAITSSIV